MTRIVIFDGYTVNPGDNPWSPLAELGELTVFDRSSPEEALERAADAEIALTNKVLLDATVIARAAKLFGIGVLATGVNAVDLQAASARGIPVCNVPSYSTVSVAQHAIALLLELCHRVGLHDASVHAGDWQKSPDFSYCLSSIAELEGKSLGIVGYGAIGRRVAAAARGLGMQVRAAELGHARSSDSEVERLPLDQLFQSSDVITLHCPLTPETKHLVSTARLALMKPTSFLINTARGALIDELALRHALDSGTIAGAALDVLSSEPPRDDNPLLSAKNCVITPHIAWTSLPARKRLLEITVENVRALLSGQPIHVANPDYARATR
ncbi:MAG TPA: D-2-hydroxyacid dehydrogenase [Polyangiaceae bacterium]|jgi:glycerate dehydrogenase|nr:D-2-hydroxyacid dehydrogenase [Polyangiaceae bacterium]